MAQRHYANPANCIDPEPAMDPKWQPSQRILNLDSLGPVGQPIEIYAAKLDSIGPSFEIANKGLCLEGPNDLRQFLTAKEIEDLAETQARAADKALKAGEFTVTASGTNKGNPVNHA